MPIISRLNLAILLIVISGCSSSAYREQERDGYVVDSFYDEVPGLSQSHCKNPGQPCAKVWEVLISRWIMTYNYANWNNISLYCSAYPKSCSFADLASTRKFERYIMANHNAHVEAEENERVRIALAASLDSISHSLKEASSTATIECESSGRNQTCYYFAH